MRLLTVLLFFITLGIFAQDTTTIDKYIAEAKGKTTTYKYLSATTGTKVKSKLKLGLWSYYDIQGNLLKTEEYVASGKSSFLAGNQIFYNSEGKKILVRSYQNNKLKKEVAYLPGILILNKDTLTIVQIGDSVFIDYPKQIDMTWFNYSNVLRINTIEDPDAPQKLAKYKAFEDSIGNKYLLQNGAFTTRHPENVIANPGFEDHPSVERSKTSFNEEVTSWLPASGTPDFFITPAAARGGIAFAGIRIYSISKDVEYIQNKLNHRLLKGQKYCFSAYVKLSPSSIATDAFGVHFSSNAIQFKNLEEENIQPHLSLDKEFLTYKSRWMILQCIYTANGTENWMTLGSFKSVDSIRLYQIPGGADSYYYIDDVSLVPIDSEEECPCNIDGNSTGAVLSPKNPELSTAISQNLELEFGQLQIGENFILQDVFFDVDKYEILSRSETILTNLANILVKYPKMEIELSGHTSNTGDYKHNIELAKNRADAVKKFLVKEGVSGDRLTTDGFGPDRPIAPNDTEPNRQMNRRVEVKLLKR